MIRISPTPLRAALAAALTTVSIAISSIPAAAQDSNLLLYGTEGNRLRRYDVDTIGSKRLAEEVLVERASDGEFASPHGPGRDINGQICLFPDGSGRFLAGEDTDQPNPRAGWGIFAADGRQVGKLTASYQIDGAEPHGCAFDPTTGILFTSEVGEQGFGTASGQLIMWFPPYEGYPGAPGAYPDQDPTSTNFCKLAIDLGTAGSVLVAPDGSVLVSASGALRVDRFNPPFPTAPNAGGGCGALDPQGSPLVDASITTRPPGARPFRQMNVLAPGANMLTPTGLALSPQGTLYAGSVLTGIINEYDVATGALLRPIVQVPGPLVLPTPYGAPQGLAVAPDGTIYYADLNLIGTITNPSTIRPGPNGKVWRVRFDENGDPMLPEVIRDELAFPDGVALFPGNLQQGEWTTFAGSAERRFDNPAETVITPDNVDELAIRWQIPVTKVITGSPTVAAIDLPGEGLSRVVFFQSWDLAIYAARLSDGSVIWRVETDDQPGAAFPSTASVHVAKLDNRDRVFVGQGHNFYSLDAVTGEELWRFTAGTGCGYDDGGPPGLCGFAGERNQIESSAYVANGLVFFGMDVNDVATGKGGFYALDALDGRMLWFFDLESGLTCRPNPGDEIRKYDGYHSEAELGLPANFLATRSGCNHPRSANGCSNVWSSPAVDEARSALFVASSNCDMPIDPGTGDPLEMPPFDEAIFSLGFDGSVRWVWRPREFDNDDLAFGAAPNLFEIDVDVQGVPTIVDVVGIGGKDGTYYVLGRDGFNEVTGESWDDDPASHLPAALPYWETNVVDGGDIGGILSTAAVDVANRRIHFSSAPGESSVNSPPAVPQLPTVHALDMDDGSLLWQNTAEMPRLASFSSMSRIPGVVVAGTSLGAKLRSYVDTNGTKLGEFDLVNFGIGSTPIFVDGTVLVGAGIGTRTTTGSGISDIVANFPSDLTALCVPGTSGCSACDNGEDDDGDGLEDDADPGCIAPGADSEVLGDIDGDGAVGDRDQQRFLQAFGRAPGEPGYSIGADLDPPGAPDGVIGLVDWQRWLAAEEAFNAPPPPPACGLIGIELLFPLLPLFAPAALTAPRARRRRPLGRLSAGLALAAALLVARDASALTTLFFEPGAGASVEGGVLHLRQGQSASVEIRAAITPSTPIVGWGLDVVHDEGRLLLDPAVVGAAWLAVSAADGDGLAGLALPPGVSGNPVLLASVVLHGLTRGLTELSLGTTAGDRTEGFALRAIGAFDTVSFGSALPVLVTPEPGSGPLVALALVGLGIWRRPRSRRSRAR